MHKYKEVYNGNTIVLRKVKQTGGKIAASTITPIQDIQKAAPPTKLLDAKALRAKLTAELFKSL